MQLVLLWHTDHEAIKKVLESKGVHPHKEALLRHMVYMFSIEDISRVTTHQLIRHRVASYDQESQRFSSASRESFVIPPSIAERPEAVKLYDEALQVAAKTFEAMIALGVPKEDARYVMPHAIKTKLVMTLSGWSLKHIAELRTAPEAQWEIRELVSKMYQMAADATPDLLQQD
ncbi:MAG: FAD-dependent thymidylate synthase [Nitrososphaerota archaeon]|nr:FAD-dependent thymidylate synthase [Nitrososphaerota archaeon]